MEDGSEQPAEANLYDAPDDALAVYAADRSAALVPQAPAVLGQHLTAVIDVLDRMPDVVIEVRSERLIVSPQRWE